MSVLGVRTLLKHSYGIADQLLARAIRQLEERIFDLSNHTHDETTTSEAGFAPALSGDAATFLAGDGTWTGAGGGGSPAVPTTRAVNTSSPLTGGGTLAADLTIDLDETVAIGNNARVAVRKNTGAVVGTRRQLNLIEGSNVTLTVADDAGGEEVDVTIASTGGITPKRVAGAVFDGQGAAPTAGSVAFIVIPFNGTIDQWHIVADASGSCVVDVWKAAGSIPTDANRIAGTEKPTLTAAQLASDTSLTTWSTLAVTAGDVLGFELESASTLTRVAVEVRIAEAA